MPNPYQTLARYFQGQNDQPNEFFGNGFNNYYDALPKDQLPNIQGNKNVNYDDAAGEAYYEDTQPDGPQGMRGMNVSYEDSENEAFNEDPLETNHAMGASGPRAKVMQPRAEQDYGQNEAAYNQKSLPTSAPSADKKWDFRSNSIQSPSVDLGAAIAAASEKARTGRDIRDIYRDKGYAVSDAAGGPGGNAAQEYKNKVANLRLDALRGSTGAYNQLSQLFKGESASDIMGGRTRGELADAAQMRADADRMNQREMMKQQIAAQQAQQNIANQFRAEQLRLQSAFQQGQITAEQARIENEKLKVQAQTSYQNAMLDLSRNDPTRKAQEIKNDLMSKFTKGEKLNPQQYQTIGVDTPEERQLKDANLKLQLDDATRKSQGQYTQGEERDLKTKASIAAQSYVDQGMSEPEAQARAARQYGLKPEQLVTPETSTALGAIDATAKQRGYATSADLYKAALDQVVKADRSLDSAGHKLESSSDYHGFDTSPIDDPDYRKMRASQTYAALVRMGVPPKQAEVVIRNYATNQQ